MTRYVCLLPEWRFVVDAESDEDAQLTAIGLLVARIRREHIVVWGDPLAFETRAADQPTLQPATEPAKITRDGE